MKQANCSNAQFERIHPTALSLKGAWTVHGIAGTWSAFQKLAWGGDQTITIDGSAVSQMDTAGALLLAKIIGSLEQRGIHIQLNAFRDEYNELLSLIAEQDFSINPPAVEHYPLLYRLGAYTFRGLWQLRDFLAFLGELCTVLLSWFYKPQRIRWRAIWAGVESTGYEAIYIVALLAFLIGVVLAYQLGVQLREYGANIFVVDLLGIAVFREFGPLLTAIIVAGRTGSSYTAQIGTMKLNEEIDAMRTLGLTPAEYLVLPRVLALFLALPLLSVLADVFGILGGMVMSRGMLEISYLDFLKRFGSVVELKNYVIGLIKAPVFAVLIASIGCFQGFQVKNSAESVGRHTTTSVVQGIFMIIVADAGFSVLYSMLGL